MLVDGSHAGTGSGARILRILAEGHGPFDPITEMKKKFFEHSRVAIGFK